MDIHQITDLEVTEVSLVGAPATAREFLLFKNEGGAPAPAATEADPKEGEGEPKGEPTPEPAPVTTPEPIQSPELDAQAKSAELAQLSKANGMLQKQVDGLVKDQRISELTQMAKADGWVQGSAEEHAERIYELEKAMGSEFAAKEITREKALAAQAKTSTLLNEVGKGGTGAMPGTAAQELQNKAKEKVAKSEAPDIKTAQTAVLSEDRDLAARFLAERNGRG